MNVLLVCTGNTCRSPMAEVFLKKLLSEKGITDVTVQSAGLSAHNGFSASGNAVAAVKKYGCDLSGHRSQLFGNRLAAWADRIIVMSPGHLELLDAMYPECSAKTEVLRSGISDPYGGSPEIYEMCAAQIYKELEKLVAGGFGNDKG